MAIIVELVNTNLDKVTATGDQTWIERIKHSEEYGYPLNDALPTSPRELGSAEWAHNAVENIRYRTTSDGLIFYTLPGLLHSIYSFFELESDHRNGISQLQDITTSTVKLQGHTQNIRFTNQVESIGRIAIPDYVYNRNGKVYLNNGLMHDVTKKVKNLSGRIPIGRDYHQISELKQVEGMLTIHPFIHGNPQDRIKLASIKLQAFNLPGMGNDMDDVTAMAIWNR